MTMRRFNIDAPDQQRLKIARAEIEAVLKKHDIGGAVVLHTPGMTEWFYDIRPSYSCAWIDDAASMVRVRSKLADFGGDAEAQRRGQAATANLLHGHAHDLGQAAIMFLDVAHVADQALRAEHTTAAHVADQNERRRQ
jgi:hypothetical protein